MENEDNVHIIDLRETETYKKNHINGSISRPIDDFLKEIFEGMYYSKKTDLKIILVCDTGQLSKVAASIMTEEGFTQVYNIKGGMRRWNRWMKLSRKMLIIKIPSCCTQIPQISILPSIGAAPSIFATRVYTDYFLKRSIAF